MTELTFGYSDSEDRIWLSVSTGRKYWLTRRMVLGFLPKAAALLENTVAGDDIPHALPASERVALEHAEALEEGLDGKPALEVNKETRANPPGSERAPAPPLLITSLSASAKGNTCMLILQPDDKDAALTLKRIEFHRLLNALVRTARNAHWDLRGLPDWLGRLAT
jgi:hypothetical protein